MDISTDRLVRRLKEKGWSIKQTLPRGGEGLGDLIRGEDDSGDIHIGVWGDREGLPELIEIDSWPYRDESGREFGQHRSSGTLPWRKEVPTPEEAAGILDTSMNKPDIPF